jgi:type VI secretion system protein ImpM
MAPLGAPGLFGKLPGQGDFVRVRAGEPAAQELARWLEEASEAAGRAGVTGGGPVRFLLRPGGGPRALIGALAPSQDRVGRRFPLAVFAPVEDPALGAAWPALPAAARPFLDAACGLLAESPGLAAADLPARLAALPPPGPLPAAQAGAQAEAQAAPLQDSLARLFGGLEGGQHLYGLHCLRQACRPVRAAEPAGTGVTLACPAPADLDRWLWLELVRRALAWKAPPGLLWTEGEGGRLLVALGRAPAGSLAVLWSPGRADPKVWLLTTTQPAAVAAARQALGPALERLLDRPGAHLADLVATLTP